MRGRTPILCPHGILGKSKCRKCHNEYVREWKRKNREKVNKYQRNRYWSNGSEKEKLRKRERSEYYKMREKRDRKKIKARRVLLLNPDKYPLKDKCEFCGSIRNLQHGHIDYDFPEIYLTVCASCNMWMDKK